VQEVDKVSFAGLEDMFSSSSIIITISTGIVFCVRTSASGSRLSASALQWCSERLHVIVHQ